MFTTSWQGSCFISFPENEAVCSYIGKDLCGMEYEPLFDYARDIVNGKKSYFVVSDSYVTMEDGTFWYRPYRAAFGEDDARVGKRIIFPLSSLLMSRANFRRYAGEFAGMFVKDADPLIIRKLNV